MRKLLKMDAWRNIKRRLQCLNANKFEDGFLRDLTLTILMGRLWGIGGIHTAHFCIWIPWVWRWLVQRHLPVVLEPESIGAIVVINMLKVNKLLMKNLACLILLFNPLSNGITWKYKFVLWHYYIILQQGFFFFFWTGLTGYWFHAFLHFPFC